MMITRFTLAALCHSALLLATLIVPVQSVLSAAAAHAAEAKAATAAPPKPAAKPEAKKKPAPQKATAIAPKEMPPAQILSAADQAIGIEAMREASALRFDKAREIAARAKEPIIGRLVHWLWLQTANSGAPFAAITAFIDASPDWPAREALLRRAEEAAGEAGTPDSRTIDWFTQHPPETAIGADRFAEALMRQGRETEAVVAARKAWTTGTLPLKDENELLKNFGAKLTDTDHAARLDHLLWDEQFDAARRMLPRVSQDIRSLGEARIALALRLPNADKIAAALPANLQNDPGLAYDRMRWNRRKGLDDIVESLLYDAPSDIGDDDRAEKWWVERHYRARKAMVDGRISEAYRLAAGHRQNSGQGYVEAEWLAGWIALRLLQEPKTALAHFLRLKDAAKTPVSRARASYWLGRAHETVDEAESARAAYEDAARYPTVFYGQLAAFKLNPSAALDLPQESDPPAEAIRRFDKREVVRAAKILMELGQEERLRPFILRLVYTAETLEEHRLAARLARTLGRVDLAVMATKRTARLSGIAMVREAFPLVEPLAQASPPEPALVLAVSRQESEFNQNAISPAGAMGLMQLMPATAKGVAKELNKPFHQPSLTKDASYNVQLGTHYLNKLLQNWDGNLILTLASYNAGEARARKWIRDWGDPRLDGIDAIDWVELIPFSETRNYVQRVIESAQVYRVLLSPKAPPANRIMQDMRGFMR